MPAEACATIPGANKFALAPPGLIDLSIVIVGWNTRDVIRACLESVFKNLGNLTAEVIVIDNGSSDHSARMIAHEFPQVRLIDNDTNRGFAAANNQGIRIARGRHVLLLNPDTVIIGDVLQETLAYARAHPDAGIVGCQVMEDATAVQRTCFRFPSPLNTFMWVTGLSAVLPRSRVAGRAAYGPWRRDGARDVDVVSGMFMLARREAIEQVGPMDEQYFVFAEEADWCRRFRDAGWRCVFAPVGRILHVDGGSKSTEQADTRMYVQMQKSVLRFHRKHLGVARWLLAKVLFTTSMVARAAWWRLMAVVGLGTAPRRKARLSAAAARYHLTGREPAW
jgi:GT2 family glycosyltransferase